MDEHHIDYIKTFFNEGYRKFEDNVWDYREFLALSHDPYNFLSILPNVKLAKDYYTLDLFELFEKFDVKNLFGYLKLDLHNDRYANGRQFIMNGKKYMHQMYVLLKIIKKLY